MVSTRQSSTVGGGGDGSGQESTQQNLSLSKPVKAGPSGGLFEGPSTSSSSSDLNSLALVCSSNNSIVPSSNHVTPAAGLLDMPPEVLEKIFTYLGYHTVAQLRLVCKQLDHVCCTILNSTFYRLQRLMLNRFQSIRAKMPRRESARRHHPLALESDIVETLHMRLTLLQMTFGKHIERKHCCFFAGEILDEVFRILHYIKVTPKLARPYKVTDELFDLSTMAMEYFKEHIEPTLPEISCFGTEFLNFSDSFSPNNYLMLDSPSGKDDNTPLALMPPPPDVDSLMEPSVPQSNMVLRKRIRKIKQGMKRYNNQLTVMRRDLRNCKSKIGEQQKLLLEYATRLDENDKKSEETSRKFSTLLQELNKCKTELQFWRSKAPANPPLCQNCGTTIPVVAGEDLQALANQGVLEGLLTSPGPTDSGEDLFHRLWEVDAASKKEEASMAPSCAAHVVSGSSSVDPIRDTASTSATCNTVISSTRNSALPPVLIPNPTSTSTSSSSIAATAEASSASSEPQVALKLGKRKMSTDETSTAPCGKLRRASNVKSRTSKRANKI